ncbi:MAG: hypothetical protein LUC38_02000 [Oscillospiraceae bacterium]|nr:hypothetical protein [Ruminococcus sp.]MCD8344720.1 hypothetical protein [Oscillospiraceae bacterium]
MAKKLLCVLLSVLMVVSILPMGVFADGSHSATILWVDATLSYSSAEAGTEVTVTPGEGLGIYELYFYTYENNAYTYMSDVEYTIRDDHTSATFVMPDYDVLVSGEIVKESVHELEYTLFAEYDWTIAQEDLEAYDGENTEEKAVTWVNSVMDTWDIDDSLTWEVSIYYLSEPVAEDIENNVEAVDGVVGIRVTLPDEDYTFGRTGTIVATTSSPTTAEILAANQELIATLSELLETDEVMYIDQLGSNDDYSWYDYFLTVYYGEAHPNWDEIVASWISSLGDEANIGLAATYYKAPVAGTEDDPDGTDGLLTMSYIADVGSAEDGTYVESSYYYVDVVIKAIPYGAHSIDPNFSNSYGYATSNKNYAVAGEEVTITVTSEYTISQAQVLYLNDVGEMCEIECTDNGDGTFTFIMPDADVWMDFFIGAIQVNDCSVSYYIEYPQARIDGVAYATPGDEVSFTMYVSSGYELDGEVTAVDAVGNTVTLTLQETYATTYNSESVTAYVYSFTAPECGVVISADFKEVTETNSSASRPDYSVLLTIRADYTAVNNAIAKANALNPDDYTNFSDVTDAINAVNWNCNMLQQSSVSAMATQIENAIAGLIPANTTLEEIEITDPVEEADTDEEPDDIDVDDSDVEESNPTTGIALSLIPMAMAALAAVSSKRR